MAFKISDANRFKKGLDAEDQKKWAEIANKALSKQLRKKVSLLEAEQIAIVQANASFGDKLKIIKFKDLKETTINIMLVEAGSSDEMQLILPTGTIFSDWYGTLMFTENFMKAMVKNQSVLKNTIPFLNRDHDRGQACAWAEDIKSSEDGLSVKWDFTSLGKQLVEDKIYKYFSAEIGSAMDVDTGERVYPVLRGCALTNSPVMKNLPDVHLHEVEFIENTLGGKEVEFKEIMEALVELNLSDEEKTELSKAAKIVAPKESTIISDKLEAQKEVVTTLNDKVKSLETALATFSADRIEAKLSEAMKLGVITPANKDKWTVRLAKNFDEFSEILDESKPEVDLGEHGSEEDNNSKESKYKASDYTGGDS